MGISGHTLLKPGMRAPEFKARDARSATIAARARKSLLFGYARLSGLQFPKLYHQYIRAEASGETAKASRAALSAILQHCRERVPYYAARMGAVAAVEIESNPKECLSTLPVLTKQAIRDNFEALKSTDLRRRKWVFNTSGGSTGEPIRLIQDREFADRTRAIAMFFDRLIEREVGEPQGLLWGSERDVIQGTDGFRAKISAWLRNDSFMNAFAMTREKMFKYLEELNRKPPRQILAYAQSIYELARFAQAEGIEVVPQNSIVTSAGTLYGFMRDKISEVFQCPVYNRYGSREIGIVASERPDAEGLWTFPTGSYVEILDEQGRSLPPYKEGNIVVTCLTNFAMPLLRYEIGDRGILAPSDRRGAQILKGVSGRIVDIFKTNDGTLIDGEYFTHLLYFREWIKKFQVVQQDYDKILIRILVNGIKPSVDELEEIVAKARAVMGPACQVKFDFADSIHTSGSGKFRYTISEIQ